jgi:hypothetical protein
LSMMAMGVSVVPGPAVTLPDRLIAIGGSPVEVTVADPVFVPVVCEFSITPNVHDPPPASVPLHATGEGVVGMHARKSDSGPGDTAIATPVATFDPEFLTVRDEHGPGAPCVWVEAVRFMGDADRRAAGRTVTLKATAFRPSGVSSPLSVRVRATTLGPNGADPPGAVPEIAPLVERASHDGNPVWDH